jgi:hypothetical protein
VSCTVYIISGRLKQIEMRYLESNIFTSQLRHVIPAGVIRLFDIHDTISWNISPRNGTIRTSSGRSRKLLPYLLGVWPDINIIFFLPAMVTSTSIHGVMVHGRRTRLSRGILSFCVADGFSSHNDYVSTALTTDKSIMDRHEPMSAH